jgi:hypothetical protein
MNIISLKKEEVYDIFETLILDKYKHHIQEIKSIFMNIFSEISNMFLKLSNLKSQLKCYPNSVEAINNCATILKTIFYDKKWNYFDGEQINQFLYSFNSFDKFTLFLHSVYHVEVFLIARKKNLTKRLTTVRSYSNPLRGSRPKDKSSKTKPRRRSLF